MGNLFSLLWKMLASIAAALGFAAVARKYTEPPPDLPPERVAEQAGAHISASPLPGVPPAIARSAIHGAPLKPGGSRPKPETIPPPTYWPAVFTFGIMYLMWGLISNIFLFCF